MHVSVPDTREVKLPQSSPFLLYNIHINGFYHCSLRFKQLLHLHTQLCKRFGSYYLPSFPSKKLLPLSLIQVEDRRLQLEKYLQNISQDKTIRNSDIFNLFLLEAQRESAQATSTEVLLEVELVNGQKIRLNIISHDSTDAILASMCRALGLNERCHAYFCLCLCGYDVIKDKLIMKRRLCCFESPFLTLQTANQTMSSNTPSTIAKATFTSSVSSNHSNNSINCKKDQYNYVKGTHQSNEHNQGTFTTHRILLRKSYWDPIYDTCAYLIDDRKALNLLFIQTVYDVKHNLIHIDEETYHQLETFLANDAEREYVLLARTLKFYNYLHFEPCISDYPRSDTKVIISVGNRELNMQVISPNNFSNDSTPSNNQLRTTTSFGGGNLRVGAVRPVKYYNSQNIVEEEYNFKIPHIRCWRLTSITPSNGNCNFSSLSNHMNQASKYSQQQQKYELSFEYLIAKDTLKWITISSDQAIFISVSIQEVVDELVSKRDGLPFRGSSKPAISAKHPGLFTYMDRGGSQRDVVTTKDQSTALEYLANQHSTTQGSSTFDVSVRVFFFRTLFSLHFSLDTYPVFFTFHLLGCKDQDA